MLIGRSVLAILSPRTYSSNRSQTKNLSCIFLRHFAYQYQSKNYSKKMQRTFDKPAPTKEKESDVMYVDTHTHLHSTLSKLDLKFEQYEEFKKKYLPPNLEAVINVSCEPKTNEASLHFLQYDGVYGAIGCHPHNAKEYSPEIEKWIESMMAKHSQKVLAWGECGLDCHYKFAAPEEQRPVFISQIKAAIRLSKPLVVHSREAEADTLNIFREHLPREHRVHVHCFTDGPEYAKALVTEWPNLYIGFTGAVTFKNAESLRETIKKHVPLERILLETDAPYMAPLSQRGKTCHSGMIPETAKQIATLKGVTLDEVLRVTRQNTTAVYGI